VLTYVTSLDGNDKIGKAFRAVFLSPPLGLGLG
jgi:hypothetical protein